MRSPRVPSDAEQSPTALRRRRFLTGCGAVGASAVAGCLADPHRTDEPEASDTADSSKSEADSGESDSDNSKTATENESSETGDEEEMKEENDETELASSWPAYGFDAGNTGSHPSTTGPDEGALDWTFDGGTPTMNSSPIVSNGIVYATPTGGDGGLLALDAETGNERWHFRTEGWTTSAPGFDGERLFVGTNEHRFYAVDADAGTELWSLEPGHRFGDSSPVVANGTVYVGSAGDAPLVVGGPEDEKKFEAPAILALEAATGKERWRYDEFGERDTIYSSAAVANGLVYFVDPEGELYALDADSGDPVWRQELEAHSHVSPAVFDGVVYCTGRGADDSDGLGRLWALDAASGEALWSTGVDELSLRTSPAIADGTVYVAGSTRGACTGFDEECDPISRGSLFAIDADTGDQRWRVEIEPDTRSSPAVADGIVYVGCDTSLIAVGTDGKRRFQVDFAAHEGADEARYVKSSPAVADGRAYVSASDGRLYAVR